MPILQGTVTFSRYRVEPPRSDTPNPKPPDPKRAVPKGLRTRAFEPLDPKGDEDRAAGFVELEDVNGTEFAVGNLFRGDHALFAFRVDTLKVPSSALKAEMTKWQELFVQENDRKPSRTEKSQSKANLRDLLRKRAVPVTKTHDVAWNLKTQRLEIWTASRKQVEEIQLALEEAFSVTLEPLVPAAQARADGIADAALVPTAALLGVEIAAEVNHGEA